MTEFLFLFLIAFGSAFTLGVTGFGVGLVSMPFLSWLLGVQIAAPLVALYGPLLNLIIWYYYRVSFSYRAVTRLILGSVFGVPLGVWGLSHLNESLMLRVLGLVLVAYSAYVLIVPRLPEINQGSGWSYGFGFIAGCLGGAYNAFAPPLIIYGNLRRWPRDEFKSNLQGVFVANAAVVIVAHALNGGLSWPVWRVFALVLPGCLLGLAAGLWLDRFINQLLFRKLVIYLLLLLGLALLFG